MSLQLTHSRSRIGRDENVRSLQIVDAACRRPRQLRLAQIQVVFDPER